MNDLERDLKQLFDDRAARIDVSPLAPQPVLRRGRRRQVRTAVGGALAGIAVIVMGFAGFRAVVNDQRTPAVTPAPGPALDARSATIAGFTIDVPQGWSLVDWWAATPWLPTQTCFSSVGSEVTVGPDGSFSGQGTPVDGSSSSEPSPQETTTCQPINEKVGLPILQLSHVDVGMQGFECDGSSDSAKEFLTGDQVVATLNEGQVDVQRSAADGGSEPFVHGTGPCGEGDYLELQQGGDT